MRNISVPQTAFHKRRAGRRAWGKGLSQCLLDREDSSSNAGGTPARRAGKMSALRGSWIGSKYPVLLLLMLGFSFLLPAQLGAQSPGGENRNPKPETQNPKPSTPPLAEENPYAVTTFECAGIYWKIPKADECAIRYRQEGAADWKEGFGLVYDPRDGEYRGSLVGLRTDAAYEIELRAGDQKATLKTRTRSDVFPVGKTTRIESAIQTEPIVIKESGTPDAYHLVAPSDGAKAILNAMNSAEFNLVIDADYVIVRGLELRNAAIHGILIQKNRHDIVVESCRVTFWGRIGGPRSFGNEGGSDSAIYAQVGTARLTIQRNLLEHPRGASNDWDTGHPDGPQGISIINSAGGNVLRYNEIWSTEDHGFNDGIGGGSNFSLVGNVNRDSDVYGNIIRNVWDDAIESEGANMNVRIWGNYLHFFFNGVATACTSKGPLYVFRNVLGESRRTHLNPVGGSVIKVGDRDEFGGGRRLVFHNTALQPRGVMNAFANGSPDCLSRNNIFDCPGRLTSSEDGNSSSDFGYDLFTGYERGPLGGKRSRRAKPVYVTSYYLEFYPASTSSRVTIGKFDLVKGDKTLNITDPVSDTPNPILDTGVVLPNFNDGYVGKAPDLGAFEAGAPPLRFGRRAYLNYDEGWAPWEKH